MILYDYTNINVNLIVLLISEPSFLRRNYGSKSKCSIESVFLTNNKQIGDETKY